MAKEKAEKQEEKVEGTEKEYKEITDFSKKFIGEVAKKYKKEIKAAWFILTEPTKQKEERKEGRKRQGEQRDVLLGILLNNLTESKEKIKQVEIFLTKYPTKTKNINIKIYPYLLTEYFEDIMKNKEEVFSEIKKSIIFYDPSGIIKPIKILIEKGKIKRTKEAMLNLIIEVGNQIREIKEIKLEILSDIYSAVIDAAQAPLLLRGYAILIPSTLPSLLQIFLKGREIPQKTIEDFMEIYNTYKEYEHGKINDIDGKKLDKLMKSSDKFIDDMQHLARKLMS